MKEKKGDILHRVVRVRAQLIDEGYHFPNEVLLDIDFAITELGGVSLEKP